MIKKAAIITIGDELLIGQIVDSNSAYIARELNKIGIRIDKKYSIGDQKEAIIEVLDTYIGKLDIILFTGGLGPTRDDITKETLNEYFGGKLIRHEETYRLLENYFKSRNRPFEEVNQQQAYVPHNCRVLLNTEGTAPGMLFEHKGSLIFSLPGVPFEMEYLMQEEVIPILKKEAEIIPLVHATLHTVGIPESTLMLKIQDWENALAADLKLAYLPTYGTVRLRLTCWTPGKYSEDELYSLFDPIRKQLGNAVFGEGDTDMTRVLFELLKVKNKKVSFAESCTGGYLAHQLTLLPGASNLFNGSIVTYSYDSKESELKVPMQILKEKGAVSEEVVRIMAEEVRLKFRSDYGVATSGIAGPTGATPDKPVGTVWIAVSSAKQTIAKRFQLGPKRDRNIKLSGVYAYNMLRILIQSEEQVE